jgi:hypothetical protein
MSEETVEIRGEQELLAKINRLANVGAILRAPMVQSAEDLRREMSVYPPATKANQPPAHPPGWYYIRGTGRVYVHAGATYKTSKSGKTRVAPGKSLGFGVTFGGETVYKTSEQLRQRWSNHYTFSTDVAEAVIGNSASYVRYVHDRDMQAKFHQWRGWRTVQGTVNLWRDRILDRFKAAIDAVLQG